MKLLKLWARCRVLGVVCVLYPKEIREIFFGAYIGNGNLV